MPDSRRAATTQAYVLHTADNKYSLRLHHIASKSDVEILAPQEMHLYSLQFSSDGSWIYFGGAKGSEQPAVHRMPIFGGTPEVITRRPIHHFSISPDGSRIAMYRRVPEESSHYLDVCKLSAADHCVQLVRLTGGDGFKIWGTAPAWSADGKRVLTAVFSPTGSDSRDRQYLAEVNVDSGELREIKSPDWHAVHQAYWSRDGRFIYAMVREHAGDQVQLWRLEQATGNAVRITNDSDDYREFRSSADGSFLVANTWRRAENLFLVDLDKPSEVRQLSFDDFASNGAVALKWLPESQQIVFSRVDQRSVSNLWRMDLKTGSTSQLTFERVGRTGSADVAPDSKTIFFESDRSGSMQIWRSGGDGSDAEMITSGAVAAEPEISADGKWLYYSQEGTWKMRLEDRSRVKVLDRSTSVIRVSPKEPDVFAAFYFDEAERVENPWKLGIFREGQHEPITVIRARAMTFDWKPDGSGLYFIDNGETFSNVWFQQLNGSEPTKITNFSDQKISNFSLAADGRSMILSRGVSTSRVLKIDIVS